MTRDAGASKSARHPDLTAPCVDFPKQHRAELTSSLQHVDGEHSHIPLQRSPVDNLPSQYCRESDSHMLLLDEHAAPIYEVIELIAKVSQNFSTVTTCRIWRGIHILLDRFCYSIAAQLPSLLRSFVRDK